MDNLPPINATTRKTFKLSMAGEPVIDLVIEGSEEIVNSFIKKTLLGESLYDGAFTKSRDVFSEMIINGVKLKMETIFRDEKGHFMSKEQVKKKIK